jgi:hypothetical protein
MIAIENIRLFNEVQTRTRRAGEIDRRAAGARRGQPGGQLDALSRNGIDGHRCQSEVQRRQPGGFPKSTIDLLEALAASRCWQSRTLGFRGIEYKAVRGKQVQIARQNEPPAADAADAILGYAELIAR